jgi:phage terminase large subunit
LKLTSSYRKIVTGIHDSRITIVQGGTSAGKTYAILQVLIIGAYKGSITGLISIVSESLPHLKRGALRDFKKILQDNGLYSVSNHNRTDNTYTINSTTFEFFSADQDDKLRGARRDYQFINEANNISYQAWSELFIRTRKWSIIDFNPVAEFWAHTEILGHPEEDFRDKVRFVKLNYTHNEALDQVTIDNIESRKHDKDWFNVFGLGEIGSPSGVIFPPSV